MMYCTCPECKVELEIDPCDTTPGCREMEEVVCPVCNKIVTKVFTSGIPLVHVVKK